MRSPVHAIPSALVLALVAACASAPEAKPPEDAKVVVTDDSDDLSELTDEPECAMDVASLEPTLVGATKVTREERSLIEEGAIVVDKATIPVRHSRSGCAHFAEVFQFTVPREDNLDKQALKLLGAARVKTETGEGPPSLHAYLAEVGGADDSGYFACGDAVCSVEYDDDDGALIVTYDFPL